MVALLGFFGERRSLPLPSILPISPRLTESVEEVLLAILKAGDKLKE